MISALLVILKFLGILILALLGLVLAVLVLVLFVPVRYQIAAHRKTGEDAPIAVKAKVTWLLHILNIAFSYPDAAYVRVRLFFFTVFRTGKPPKPDSDKKKKNGGKEQSKQPEEKKQTVRENEQTLEKETGVKQTDAETEQKPEQTLTDTETEQKQTLTDEESGADAKEEKKSFLNKFVEFFRKLFDMLRNIRYTIAGIYDKIKQVVNNIQYYINIIKSDTFVRAFGVCSKQALSLLKSIGPRKVTGSLVIGTGDPAGTGQVMAAYGILYPLIGDHIAVTPDFERQIVEGDLLIKGKITVFRAVKTAWIIYFNRDLRRLIQLFKREAA